MQVGLAVKCWCLVLGVGACGLAWTLLVHGALTVSPRDVAAECGWGCADLLQSCGLAGRLCFSTNSDSILLTPFLPESGVWSTFCSFPLPEDGEVQRRLGGGLGGTASPGSNGSDLQACVNLHLSTVSK